MRKTLYIIFVFGALKYTNTNTQYLTIGTNKKSSPKTSICDQAKSSLVEHFFNIIFAEFRNTPPVCVCVQMCPEQPTYCYPNGCLKKTERNKKAVPVPVTRLSENTKPIFFIDEKNDFMNDFLAKNYIDDNVPVAASPPTQSESPVIASMRPDPFKDRYKILFKYKKMPKVELKYNLGEQVKNMHMKSEILKTEHVDVSKTRWPMNKIDRRLGRQGSTTETQEHKTTINSAYFMAMFPDKAVASFPPKYFKRELSNNTHTEDDEEDVKEIYIVGKSDSESNAFSLDKLIDSLIESSFDNSTAMPESDKDTNTTANEAIIEIEEPKASIKDNTTKRTMKNETTNVISMNFTNENVDKNKYSDDVMTNNSKSVTEMIATLSKRIDKQNNTSLEMMRRITGAFEFESPNNATEKPIDTPVLAKEVSDTEYTTLRTTDETRTTRKIRQRIVRKMQLSKNN